MQHLRQLLSFLAGELAQSHGQKLFAQLCEALGIYMNARGALIAEWCGPEDRRKARVLAYWLDGQQMPSSTYDLAGTPCYETRAGQLRVYHSNVWKLFPDDPEAQTARIDSYVGVPFANSDGQVIGHLALFDVKPRAFPANELDAIRIAAVRAGAELHRMRADREVIENERRYSAIANKAIEAIMVWRDGEVLDCNATAVQMFSGSREQLIGRTMLDLAPALQADGTPTAHRMADLQATASHAAQPLHWRYQRLDGSTFDSELVVQTVTIDDREHLVTLSRDISQRLLRQAELTRSESTLRAVLEHSPIAMLVCSAAGRIEMVNRQFESLFGYSRQDVATLDHWWRLAFPDVQAERDLRCQWYERLVEAHATGRPASRPIETTICCADGSRRFVQIKCVQVGQRQLATIQDLTEQHEALALAERARRAAESANDAKDEFLAALSHELRTPLTPVLIAASHLQTLEGVPEEVRSLVSVIRRNSEMEARLIDDLLDIARIRSGKLQLNRQPINVHDAISAALQICWSDIVDRNIHIVQELNAKRPTCNADPGRLQQVFWNLLKNAVKFTPNGGRITLRSYNVAPAAGASEEPELIVEVIDDGVGMTKETIATLFTAFYQGSSGRQFGGLGQGLSIARQIVSLHGGRIEARSAGPDAGSTFRVALPTTAAQTAPRAAEPPISHAHTDGRARILLVEDHESTGKLLTGVLNRFGHDVYWAHSVKQAREILGSHDGFDLLLSDLGLPDGSGLDIMPVFRERTGRPGIAFSGYGTDQDLRKTRDAGFALHLVKPVDVLRLREAIRALAGKA